MPSSRNNMISQNMICMAKCARPKGLKGDLHLDPYMEDPESLAQYNPYCLYDKQQNLWHGQFGDFDPKQVHIAFKHWHKSQIVVKIDGIDNREDADKINGTYLYIPRASLKNNDDDTYYHIDLMTCNVIDGNQQHIGNVTHILTQSAQDMMEIQLHDHKNKKILVPFHHDTIADIDIANKKIFLCDALEYWLLEE